MSRESTSNIGLTYETDENSNFSYDDDIKGNLITVDNAIKEDRDRLDKLDTPKTITIGPTTADAITLENSVIGQLDAIKMSALTLINDIPNGDFSAGTAGWVASYSTLTSLNNILNITCGTSTTKNYVTALTNWSTDDVFFYYAKVRTTNPDATSITLRDVSSKLLKEVENPEENKWYELYKKGTPEDNHLQIRTYYPDATIATGKVTEIEGWNGDNANAGVFAINMTALGIEDYTEEQMLAEVRKGFFIAKSTLSQKITSSNVNRFDGILEEGSISSVTGDSSSSSVSIRSKNFHRTKEGVAVSFKGFDTNLLPTSGNIFFYDYAKNYISSLTGLENKIPPAGAFYHKFRLQYNSEENRTIDNNIAKVMLIESTLLPSTYTKHEDSVGYWNVPTKDGTAKKLIHPTTGATVAVDHWGGTDFIQEVSDKLILDGSYIDEISDLTDGQRVRFNTTTIPNKSEWTNYVDGKVRIKNRNECTFSSVGLSENIGKFATRDTNKIYISFPLGTFPTQQDAIDYFNANSDELTYQMAKEKNWGKAVDGSPQSYDRVTHVFFEPVIRFEAIADVNGEITIPHPTQTPIDFIEKVQEKIINADNISYVDVSYSQIDNIKIGGLTYGKKYRIIYHYPKELTTSGIKTITYSVSCKHGKHIESAKAVRKRIRQCVAYIATFGR